LRYFTFWVSCMVLCCIVLYKFGSKCEYIEIRRLM
jgi:hypothetical protein